MADVQPVAGPAYIPYARARTRQAIRSSLRALGFYQVTRNSADMPRCERRRLARQQARERRKQLKASGRI